MSDRSQGHHTAGAEDHGEAQGPVASVSVRDLIRRRRTRVEISDHRRKLFPMDVPVCDGRGISLALANSGPVPGQQERKPTWL